MNYQRILVPVFCLGLLYVAWGNFGPQGLALAGGAIVMWLLLHFNRLMQVMRKAANRPVGYVPSAVMLNARLREGLKMVEVMGMTGAFGELLSVKGQDPETYRWKDNSDSYVDAVFTEGKLQRWQLVRPAQPEEAAPPAADVPPPAP